MASRKEVEEKLSLKRVILWRFITDKLWFRGCPLNKSQGQFFLKGKNEINHCVYWVHIRPPVWENPCSKGRSTLWPLACGNIRFSSLFAAGDVSRVPPRVQSNLGQQKEETGIASRPPPPPPKKNLMGEAARKLVCYTAVFRVVTDGEERCVTTLKTAV